MAYIPHNHWYIDLNVENNRVHPKATLISVNMCMACHQDCDNNKIGINTMSQFPSFNFICCKNKDCIEKTKVGLANFYKNYGNYIMLFHDELVNVKVPRSNGDVEEGWTVSGFFTNHLGVASIYVTNRSKAIYKSVQYADFISHNPDKRYILNKELDDYFDHIYNMLTIDH